MEKKFIYQTGTINSLLEAVYAGDINMNALLKHGDFGLGALNDIDGELIVYNGICYRADAHGNLHKLTHTNYTPFAMVNKFEPEHTFYINNLNFEELETQIAKYFPSLNLIYAIKISGSFKHLDLRSEYCTCRPYKRLTEILPSLQTTFERDNINGVMIGVWFPEYLSQLNVPGFHFHFLDDKLTTGGHVFGVDLIDAKVELQILYGLQVELIQNDDFYNAELNRQNKAEVAQVEQVRL